MDVYNCYVCHKNFFNSLNLNIHSKSCSKSKSFFCSKCNKVFYDQSSYNNHYIFCGKCICHICQIPFLTSHALDHHTTEVHNSSPPKSLSRPYTCSKCSYKSNSKSDLYLHRLIQHGRGDANGDLQDVPWSGSEDPFDNDEVRNVYYANKSYILAPHSFKGVKYLYNFPTNNLSNGYKEIEDHITEIYNAQSNAFKINFSLGLILYNAEKKTYRYFIPYHNTRVLSHPRMISSSKSISLLMHSLRKMDIISLARKDRPSSAWTLVFITNINYYVYKTDFYIGYKLLSSNIPQYLSLNKNIKHFASPFNICFFQCLDYHNKKKYDPFYYFKKWMKYSDKEYTFETLQSFPGVFIKDFFNLEKCFDISINVYNLSENGNACRVFNSNSTSSDVLYLNLYDNHLGYITNIDGYSLRYECSKCFRIFPKRWRLSRHNLTCFGKSKYKFPGGFFTQKDNLFKDLTNLGIDIRQTSTVYPYFAVWDMEALLLKTSINTTSNLEWTSKHIPISVSISSNVPNKVLR